MRIGIVGLGLIGGSLAAALTRAGHQVWGCDGTEAVCREAIQRGFVAEAHRFQVPSSTSHNPSWSGDHSDRLNVQKLFAASVAESDVVIMALPLAATVAAIPTVAQHMRTDALISDVASVKRPVIATMDALATGPRCVGGHPMAGKAAAGIGQADPDLFLDAPFAIVDSTRTDATARATLKRIVGECGARPVEIAADEHDAQVARTSHLPQLISSALAVALDEGEDRVLSGSGLAGMLRLAASDETSWSEILVANRDNVAKALHEFSASLAELGDFVGAGDGDGIETLMRQARESLSRPA